MRSVRQRFTARAAHRHAAELGPTHIGGYAESSCRSAETSTKPKKAQGGFTIIEILLFLAITGLLFLIGFWGTGAQIRNVRFSDSMRGMQSYLQKQYSTVATGINPREMSYQCNDPGNIGLAPTFAAGTATANDTAGDAADCILLGKLVKFQPGSGNVVSYYVVGQRLTSAELTGDDLVDIKNSGPTLSPQVAENFAANWGLAFNQPSSAGASNQTRSFAFLRSPASGEIFTFAFSEQAVTATTAPGADETFRAAVTSANLAHNAGYCFETDTAHQGIMKLGYGDRAEAIDVVFEDFNTNTDCVRSKP